MTIWSQDCRIVCSQLPSRPDCSSASTLRRRIARAGGDREMRRDVVEQEGVGGQGRGDAPGQVIDEAMTAIAIKRCMNAGLAQIAVDQKGLAAG